MATSQTDFIHNRYVVSECTLNLHYVGYFVSAEKIILVLHFLYIFFKIKIKNKNKNKNSKLQVFN